MTKKPPILGHVFFVAVAVGAALASVGIGWYLYRIAAKPAGDFYTKLGELVLQLAVIVIVGALAKIAVDWGASQRVRDLEKHEAQKEFMRRVRAMHVTVQNARDLMNAHQSAKTWGQQSRRLMQLRPDVEEISEDLKASHGLFAKQGDIIEGLEGIILYLAAAGKEYVRSHAAVDAGYKAGRDFSDTLAHESMDWVSDFLAGGDGFSEKYEANLVKSKGAMRSEVYGV